ncbi:hypothetical protein QJS10_CPB20g01229 [Acorus calamus]|uniref:Uncharacterized protein n=1 Tax=Acorus calamus TaxID=4465 RepID=A0AAV9C880_ACOCL|nr:hypothetical protein QJS10_CPB20g01229 [Acorus calamus]
MGSTEPHDSPSNCKSKISLIASRDGEEAQWQVVPPRRRSRLMKGEPKVTNVNVSSRKSSQSGYEEKQVQQAPRRSIVSRPSALKEGGTSQAKSIVSPVNAPLASMTGAEVQGKDIQEQVIQQSRSRGTRVRSSPIVIPVGFVSEMQTESLPSKVATEPMSTDSSKALVLVESAISRAAKKRNIEETRDSFSIQSERSKAQMPSRSIAHERAREMLHSSWGDEENTTFVLKGHVQATDDPMELVQGILAILHCILVEDSHILIDK